MKKPYKVRKALTSQMLKSGGTTLVGLTIVQALDEIIDQIRTEGGGQIDPLTIDVSTSRIDVLGQPSLGIEVSLTKRTVLEQA